MATTSLQLGIGSDWKVWDNRESITYTVEARTGDATHGLDDCKRRQLQWKELAASGGAYVGGDRAWLIPVAKLPSGVTPKVADRITDGDGNTWTVLDAALNTWQTWWRLFARNLVLAADLRETVALYAPDEHQDNAGGRVPSYSVTVAGLPARIQEIDATGVDQFGKLQAVRRFTAWVGQRVYPSRNWRLVAADGTIYQITAWRGADRWDVLQELDLEIVK